jgi:hypothetical protein
MEGDNPILYYSCLVYNFPEGQYMTSPRGLKIPPGGSNRQLVKNPLRAYPLNKHLRLNPPLKKGDIGGFALAVNMKKGVHLW